MQNCASSSFTSPRTTIQASPTCKVSRCRRARSKVGTLRFQLQDIFDQHQWDFSTWMNMDETMRNCKRGFLDAYFITESTPCSESAGWRRIFLSTNRDSKPLFLDFYPFGTERCVWPYGLWCMDRFPAKMCALCAGKGGKFKTAMLVKRCINDEMMMHGLGGYLEYGDFEDSDSDDDGEEDEDEEDEEEENNDDDNNLLRRSKMRIIQYSHTKASGSPFMSGRWSGWGQKSPHRTRSRSERLNISEDTDFAYIGCFLALLCSCCLHG